MRSSSLEQPGPRVTRRSVLEALLGFSFVATAAGVLTPIIGYLWPTKRREVGQAGRVRAASLAAALRAREPGWARKMLGGG